MILLFWILAGLFPFVGLDCLQYVIGCSIALLLISHSDYNRLAGLFLFSVYSVALFLESFPPELYIMIYLVFSICSLYKWFSVDVNNLEHNKDNFCLAFYRGENKSLLSKLTAPMLWNITSMSLFYNGSIWRYKHGKIIEVKHFDKDSYVMYDTGKQINQDTLANIINKPYDRKWYKINCVSIFLPLLVELGIKPRWFETIPSIYLRRLLSYGG